MLNPGRLLTLAFKKMLYSRKMGKKGFISLEIFIYFFINSDSKLTPNSNAYSKTIHKSTPNPNTNLTLILTPKKEMKKAQMNIFHFRFILFNLKIFGEIVSTRVGLNLNFEFESAHELLMNLNLNSTFAKSMKLNSNLNLVFSKSMN